MREAIKRALHEQGLSDKDAQYLHNCVMARAGLPPWFMEWIKRNRFQDSGAYQIHDLIFF